MTTRRPVLRLISIVLAGLSAVPSAGPAGDDPGVFAGADDDSVVVGARDLDQSADGGGVPSPGSDPTYLYRREARQFCGALDAGGSFELCVEGVASGTVARVCADGTVALDPLYRRQVDPTTGAFVGAWVQIDVGGCPQDPPTAVILTAADFRRLPLTASTPQLQPADGRGLVDMDLIVFTEPTPQVLSTTVLGIPVTVHATPARYTWDFGDGSDPLVTTDPGAPFPDQTVARAYRSAGTYQLTLTTTWTGTYQVNGTGPWHTVTGNATTTSAPVTTEALTATTTLVADPLRPGSSDPATP